MNHGLLRKCIRSLIIEAIRTKKGAPKFNWNEFKNLPDTDSMLEYAEQRLEELGLEEKKTMGSSRRAFMFSGGKVLKIAKFPAGIAQNEAEHMIYDAIGNKKNISVVSKVFEHDPNYRWLLVEVAKTGSEKTERLTTERFKQITGIDWNVFKQIVETQKLPPGIRLGPKTTEFITTILEMVQSADLQLADILRINHWGVTGDGNIVLIDYGFTADVKEKHYIRNPEGKWVVASTTTEREARQIQQALKQAEEEKIRKERESAASKAAPGAARYGIVDAGTG